jgi:uncharacterized protein (DUF2062 family)/2-polyprenyl-3-methyl-5-hydroxy-6-metoxy-1,4-benzoquinol methylase
MKSAALDIRAELRSKAPWRRKFWRWWRSLVNEQTSPERLGMAVAVGVFLGASPLYGLQLLLCLLFATIFRLNKIAVLLGLQISAPPFTAVLVFASFQLGSLIISGHAAPFNYDLFRKTPLFSLVGDFVLPFVAGCFAIGSVLAPIFGLLTVRLVSRHQQKRALEPHLGDEELEALLDRIEPLPMHYRSYAHWKVRLDPVYPMALPHLQGRREVLDLGGGIGILTALLLRRSPGTCVRLIDWDGRKVELARRMLGDLLHLSIEREDARSVEPGTPDAMVLIDVLHYNPLPVQRRWLTACARAVSPGGVLVIRELDSSPSRPSLAQRVEQLTLKIGWNRGDRVALWPIADMVRTLEHLGFRCTVTPAGRGAFRANALVVANKTA